MSGRGGPPRNAGNLPADLTNFVGRRTAVASMRRLLTESRLVTLTGPGGVGKTRLALRAACEVQRAFPDGIWLIRLADVGDPAQVAQLIVQTLGVQDHSQGPMSTLTGYMASRRLLLILDNCEHVIDGVAEVVAEVLPRAPQVRALATSRESLGVTGERRWVVPPLPLPEAQALFIDRGRSVGVAVDAEGAAVAEICRRLDGLPLAIELAAARLRVLSAAEILRRLDHRFHLLGVGVGARADEPRHQTLRAVVEWSHDLCSPAERRLWERCSVFAGGWDLEAAEQICAGDDIAAEDVLALVDGLVNKSIFVVDRTPDTVRYRMLDTLREYGRDKLIASDQWRLIQRRHRDYYQWLAANVRQDWFGANQLAWFARLRSEVANLSAAMEFCLRDGDADEAQHAMRLATDLFPFLISGHVSLTRRWLDRALAIAVNPTQARAGALWLCAWIASHQGDTPAAINLLEECQTVAEQLEDRGALAQVSTTSGWVALTNGYPALAVELLEKALAEHLAIGDRFWAGLDQQLLALMVSATGDIDRATGLFEECLTTCHEHGELWNRSWGEFEFALILWRKGESRRAKEMLQESLRTKIAFGDVLGVGNCLERAAWIAADEDPKRAARLLGASQRTLADIGATVPPHLRAGHEDCATHLRATLGDAFAASVEQGAGDAAAIAAAQAGTEQEPSASAPAVERPESPLAQLTRREREVAVLAAKGLSNREIATKLVLSERTVGYHMQNVLTKLGCSSRTQVAALSAASRMGRQQAAGEPYEGPGV